MPPIPSHPVGEPAVFTPRGLVAAVRQKKRLSAEPTPPICVLDFDGDLLDTLIARNEVRRWEHWPCFHTQMWLWPKDRPRCGVVSRTIGGPYAVLVAEQMAECGSKLVVGLASAGRVAPDLPLPSVVVADAAIRDEGTSLHYLAPGLIARADEKLSAALEHSLTGALGRGASGAMGLPVRRGLVRTTDAPYRETRSQLANWASMGVLAVEMQAASLFAFGQHRGFPVGLVAHVTNAVDQAGEPFDKGPEDIDLLILRALCDAGEAGSASPPCERP